MDSQDFNNLTIRSMTLIRSYVTSSCTPDPTSKIDGAINCYADYSNQEDNTTTPDPQTFPTMKLTRKR